MIPLPHQILVLEKVMQSNQNRFMLADEVGMGKTIETSLILKELKIRGDMQTYTMHCAKVGHNAMAKRVKRAFQ